MLIGTLVDMGNVIIFMKDKCFFLNNSIHKLIIEFDIKNNNIGLYRMEDNITYDVNSVIITMQ